MKKKVEVGIKKKKIHEAHHKPENHIYVLQLLSVDIWKDIQWQGWVVTIKKI